MRHGKDIKYIDHYGVYKEVTDTNDTQLEDDTTESVKEVLSQNLLTSILTEDENVEVITKHYTSEELENQFGKLYIKPISSYSNSRPMEIEEVFDWINIDGDVLRYALIGNLLVLETENAFTFTEYNFDGSKFNNAHSTVIPLTILKDTSNTFYAEPLYVESKNAIYILEMTKIYGDNILNLSPTIYKLDIENYKLEKIYDNREHSRDEENVDNFDLPFTDSVDINKIVFSYNNSIDLFLIAYIYKNNAKTPYIFEHIFKLQNGEDFLKTIESTVYQTEDRITIYNSSLVNAAKIWCSSDIDDNFYNNNTFFEEVV